METADICAATELIKREVGIRPTLLKCLMETADICAATELIKREVGIRPTLLKCSMETADICAATELLKHVGRSARVARCRQTNEEVRLMSDIKV